MSDDFDDRAMVPGVKMEPAAARPADRLGMRRFISKATGEEFAEIGQPDRGLIPLKFLSEAIGYAPKTLTRYMTREWSDQIRIVEVSELTCPVQVLHDQASARAIHVLKATGGFLSEIKKVDEETNIQLVASRVNSLYLVTDAGLFTLLNLAPSDLAQQFRDEMASRGRFALQTGQALTHDLNGNALPPPEVPAANTDVERERRLLERERRLMSKTQLGWAKLVSSLTTVDPAAREALVLDIMGKATGTNITHALPALEQPTYDATTVARKLMAGPLKGYRVSANVVGRAASECGIRNDREFGKLVATTIDGKPREQWRYFENALDPLAKRLLQRSAEGKAPHKLEVL